MYSIKELLNYKKEVQNCKIALENGQLMDSINFVRYSEWYSDDDVQYVAMAIVDDVDNKRDNFPTAIDYFNGSLRFIESELKELGLN